MFENFNIVKSSTQQWCYLLLNKKPCLDAEPCVSHGGLDIAALWSPEGKGLTSWLLFVMFIVILLLTHLVSWESCGTWLYRFLILAVFLILISK